MEDLLVNDGENEEILTDYEPDSLIEEWQKNSAWSLSLTVPKTARNALTYGMLKNESKIIFQGQQFVINHMEPKGIGPLSTVDITAPHIYFTCQDHRQYEKQSKTWSIDEAMHWAFDDNILGFTWQIVGSFPMIQIDNFGDANALSMLGDILKKFGGVLEADNKHLILYPESEWGLLTNKQIRYQFNTDEVQMSVDTSAIKTVIRGYGKQNDDGSYVFPPVTYKSPNIDLYGERHADPIRDDRFINEDSMRAYLPTQLNDEPDVSITAPLKVKEDVFRGEHRLLIYEPMDLDIDVQVIAYKKYPAVNKPPEVTAANTVKDTVDVISGFSTTQKTFNKVIDGNGVVRQEALGTSVSSAVKKINGVITDDGMLDLTKSEGRIRENQAQIGPETVFAEGYNPTEIELDPSNIPLATEGNNGLLSADLYGLISRIPADTSGYPQYANYDSESGLATDGLMLGSMAELITKLSECVLFGIGLQGERTADLTIMSNAFLGSDGGAVSLSEYLSLIIDALGPLFALSSSSAFVFNPHIGDPNEVENAGGDEFSLISILKNFEQRISDLESVGGV